MPRTKAPEGWFKQLTDGRVEVFLRANGRKLRAHGSPEEMNELADWFEAKAGVAIEAPWRVRQGPRPIEGQMTLTVGKQDAMGSLEES